MRMDEERVFRDEELVNDFFKDEKKKENCKPLQVKEIVESDGSRVVRISNGTDTIERREHTFPEYTMKNGD